MKRVINTFREVAEVLETIETVGIQENDYVISSIEPCTDNFVTTESVRVDFEVQIPFLNSVSETRQIEVMPQDVRLGETGDLHVEFTVSSPTDMHETAVSEPSQTNPQSDPSQDNGTTSTPELQTTSTVTENPTENSSDTNDRDETAELPAYRDPEKLREVYENYDTFTEMTDALGVDVTAQTVRRYMIKHSIHKPASNTGSQTAEALLDTDPGMVSRTEDKQNQQASHPTTTTASSSTEQSKDGQQASTEADDETINAETDTASGPDGMTRMSGPASRPQTGETREAAEETLTAENEAEPDEEIDGEPDVSNIVDVELPDHLTLEDIKATVQTAQTLYEAQQQLDLNRDETRQLLQKLNLLNLVHSRLATHDLNERTIDDINQRLKSTTRSNQA